MVWISIADMYTHTLYIRFVREYYSCGYSGSQILFMFELMMNSHISNKIFQAKYIMNQHFMLRNFKTTYLTFIIWPISGTIRVVLELANNWNLSSLFSLDLSLFNSKSINCCITIKFQNYQLHLNSPLPQLQLLFIIVSFSLFTFLGIKPSLHI